MKTAWRLSLILCLLVVGCSPVGGAPPWSVYFSPQGGCTRAIVAAMADARGNIDVQAYNFTSEPIARAIIDARKRGVEVRIIVDHTAAGQMGCQAQACAAAGCQVFVDSRHKIAHNKIILIDRRIVITGSFNFSDNAETSNAENLLIIDSPALAARYLENFQLHLLHSTAVKTKPQPLRGAGAAKTRPLGR